MLHSRGCVSQTLGPFLFSCSGPVGRVHRHCDKSSPRLSAWQLLLRRRLDVVGTWQPGRFEVGKLLLLFGGFQNRSTPKWMVYKGKPIKMDDWGYHYFGNTHIHPRRLIMEHEHDGLEDYAFLFQKRNFEVSMLTFQGVDHLFHSWPEKGQWRPLLQRDPPIFSETQKKCASLNMFPSPKGFSQIDLDFPHLYPSTPEV